MSVWIHKLEPSVGDLQVPRKRIFGFLEVEVRLGEGFVEVLHEGRRCQELYGEHSDSLTDASLVVDPAVLPRYGPGVAGNVVDSIRERLADPFADRGRHLPVSHHVQYPAG